MGKYCIHCGGVLKDGACVNPECVLNRKKEEAYGGDNLYPKKPITLVERKRQIYGVKEEKMEEEQPGFALPDADEWPEDLERVENDTWTKQPQTIREDRRSEASRPTEYDRWEESQVVEEEDWSEEEEYIPTPKETRRKTGRKASREDFVESRPNALVRFPFFLRDYWREPGRVSAMVGHQGDVGVGICWLAVSIVLSAMGTFLFGSLYLEDFFFRWIVAGVLAPVGAFGMSVLYARLFVTVSLSKVLRNDAQEFDRIPFRSLFSLVGAASVLPNMILLLSTVFSPMDKSLRAFQFFALLLVAVWVASLLFSMVAAYGSYFTMGGLVLTVVFVFLAFVSMRAVWVWYLTGDFKFTLYLPLNVFFSGY